MRHTHPSLDCLHHWSGEPSDHTDQRRCKNCGHTLAEYRFHAEIAIGMDTLPHIIGVDLAKGPDHSVETPIPAPEEKRS